jgi:Leucine-rich repeat (LRR) protein
MNNNNHKNQKITFILILAAFLIMIKAVSNQSFIISNDKTFLKANGKQLKNLDLIEKYKNTVKIMDLSNNYLSNIDILSNISKLVFLDLSDNKLLNDISSLSNLTNLQRLYLSYNNISSIK